MAAGNRNHYAGSLVLDGVGNIGVARLADSFALALESGALTATGEPDPRRGPRVVATAARREPDSPKRGGATSTQEIVRDEQRRELLSSFRSASERLADAAENSTFPPETRRLWLRLVEIGERLDEIGWRPGHAVARR